MHASHDRIRESLASRATTGPRLSQPAALAKHGRSQLHLKTKLRDIRHVIIAARPHGRVSRFQGVAKRLSLLSTNICRLPPPVCRGACGLARLSQRALTLPRIVLKLEPAEPAVTRSVSKPKWRNGRRAGLKIQCPQGRVGSS